MFESDTLWDDDEQGGEDPTPARQPDVLLCGKLGHLIESARMFSTDHEQCVMAAEDLVDLVEEQFESTIEPPLTLQFDGDSVLLEGRPLSFDDHQRERIDDLRERLDHHGFNTVRLDEDLDVKSVLKFIDHLAEDDIAPGQVSYGEIEALRADLQSRETADGGVVEDEEQLVLRLYSSFVMRCRNYYAALHEGRRPRTAALKRNVQRIVDRLEDRHLVFAGLATMRLIGQTDFAHGADRAVYAMVLADAVGLDSTEISRCGLTALTPDPSAFDDEDDNPEDEDLDGDESGNGESGNGESGNGALEDLELGDATHFDHNLSSVAELARTGGHDVLSALKVVAAYERGFPVDRTMPSRWYDDQSDPHVLTRLLAVSRDFDLLVRGFGDIEPVSPDIAFQVLMEHTKALYDTVLVKLFVTTLGLYPVGSIVELSDGRRAFVVRPPEAVPPDEAGPFHAMRPLVRPLDNPNDPVDLSEEENVDVSVEQVVDYRELDPADQPDARWLF